MTAIALTVTVAPARAAFRTGFFDAVYTSADESERSAWFDRSVSTGASIVRLMPQWSAIAPSVKPRGFDASDPADPAYRWTSMDAAMRDASARGLDVIFTLNGAPTWAQGPKRPRDAGGAWRPRVAAFAAYATAAAKRYSGSYPDPLHPGTALPRIHYWQMWNEPNLSSNLQPQWTRRAGHYVATSPEIYRSLLNAGYDAVKRIDKSNVVVTAGTGPYGDPGKGGHRIQPVAFWRALLAKSARFDAFSHHPYGIRGPLSHAFNADDAAIPDLGKISRVVHAAQRRGTVTRSHKSYWVTEISWDSKPPDPFGVPEERHARWLEEAFWVLWKQGVSTVTWFQVRDQEKGRGYEFGNQSGVFLRDGRAKLAARAFRFPFVVEGAHARRTIWGMSPTVGAVRIQRLAGANWHLVATLRARSDRTFVGRIHATKGQKFRASAAGGTSLTWTSR